MLHFAQVLLSCHQQRRGMKPVKQIYRCLLLSGSLKVASKQAPNRRSPCLVYCRTAAEAMAVGNLSKEEAKLLVSRLRKFLRDQGQPVPSSQVGAPGLTRPASGALLQVGAPGLTRPASGALLQLGAPGLTRPARALGRFCR